MSKYCPNCNQKFSNLFDECAYCGSELCIEGSSSYGDMATMAEDNGTIYLKKVYFDLDFRPQSVELECSCCKKDFEIEDNLTELFEKIGSDYLIVKDGKKLCCDCGNEHPLKEIVIKGIESYYDSGQTRNNVLYNSGTSDIAGIPKCPTCRSRDIKKISTFTKASSVALWGIFSQKVKKQWHCNSCGSEW